LPESQLPDSPPPTPFADNKAFGQHRYLQSLVKRMAESRGFLVTLEKEVFGGIGKIDAALEKENDKIACEISVTNDSAYEIQNLRKCLSAGYAPVVLISADERHLAKIRQAAAAAISEAELAAVRFFTPEEFHFWIENLEANISGSEEKVKGFKVKVKLSPSGETDRSTRKKAISDVVFGALKKLKNKSKGE
jgi:hypothetical protein